MKRIFLFLLTNLAIMLVLGLVISVFGLGQVLYKRYWYSQLS
jgi:heat shock protein HtpX